MPAGDAGLEQGLVPRVEHYDSANCDCVSRWQHDDVLVEVERLQAQLAAQQAVIDAAREQYVRGVEAAIGALHTFSGYVHFARIEQHIRKQCLDKAPAAQPEGEPR